MLTRNDFYRFDFDSLLKELYEERRIIHSKDLNDKVIFSNYLYYECFIEILEALKNYQEKIDQKYGLK